MMQEKCNKKQYAVVKVMMIVKGHTKPTTPTAMSQRITNSTLLK